MFGCGKSGDTDSSNSSESSQPITVSDIEKYKIVFAKDASDTVKDAAEALAKQIKEIQNKAIVYCADSVKESEYEILIGRTNRKSTFDYTSLKDDEIAILSEKNKIIITGANDEITFNAVDYFMKNYIDIDLGTLSVPGGDGLRLGKMTRVNVSVPEEFAELVSGTGDYYEENTVTHSAAEKDGRYFKEWYVKSGNLDQIDLSANPISFKTSKEDIIMEPIYVNEEGLRDLTGYINPLIGASDLTSTGTNRGNTIIGPQNPFGSISPGPETYPSSRVIGYLPEGKFRGFVQTHFGSGGATKYGQFMISPMVGFAPGLDGHDSEKSNEFFSCYEYKVTLDDFGIECGVTPAHHSSIHRFTYPEAKEASILFDVENYLGESEKAVHASELNVSICTENGKTVMTGSGYYPQGWAKYTVYYYAEVNTEAYEIGTFTGKDYSSDDTSLTDLNYNGNGTGAYMKFSTTEGEEIYVKAAISFKSIEQAKKWLYDEIPAWDYEAVKEEGISKWNEILNKIQIDGSLSTEEKQQFYTAMYHAYLAPCDRTSDLPGEEYGDSVMTDNYIAGWDTFRTLFPLYSIIDRENYAKNINSLITRYEIEREKLQNYGTPYVFRDLMIVDSTFTNQGGDDLDNIIGEAYLKGIEGFDRDEAYELLKFNAETLRSTFPGGISSAEDHYKTIGYIPADDNGTGTRTMCCNYHIEYAYNDYVAAQAAREAGDMETYKTLITRSNSWLNIWNDEMTSENKEDGKSFSGFIWPKNADGTWVEPNEYLPSPTYFCLSWKPYFYEASVYDYSFFVPQDIYTLIEKMGGEEAFLDRLTYGFEKAFGGSNDCYINIGNEPAFLTAFMPNYTDKPYLTADNVSRVRKMFTIKGYPGAEDSGAMASWYIFSTMGIFPHGGGDFYYLTSPYTEKSTINVGDGKTFTIRAENLSDENKYIQSVTLNGKPYNSTMLKHADIICGGELVYTMGSEPVNYAKSPNAEVKSITVGGIEATKLGNGAYEINASGGAAITADSVKVALVKEGAILSDITKTDYGFTFTVTPEDNVNVKTYDIFVS